MGLPEYSGPFKVGVLDLEIPVRKPRSFCNNVVNPGVLNKPAKKARQWAKKQNREVKEKRQEKQKEPPSASAPTSTTNSSHGADSSTDSNRQQTSCEDGSCGDGVDESEEADSPWSPWTTGSKMCTLHLETVLFSIYYPALPMPEEEVKRYPRAAWLGRPVHAGVHALMQYVGQYGLFALPASPAVLTLINAHLPARVGPPLADPEEVHKQSHPDRASSDRPTIGNFGQEPPQFPVIIFSHGLAGNRLSYSQYCGELASLGIIVAAIEHRDGSGVSSIVRGEEAPDKANQGGLHLPHIGHKSSGRMKASVPYFTFEKIGLQSFAAEPSEREVNLRADQIEMRQAEIDETFYVLSEINAGRGYEVVQRSTRRLGTKLAGHAAHRLPRGSLIGSARPLEDWKGKLDMECPTLCGHSFGGATVIDMMRKANPFPMAMVLDPWVEPVRDPAKEEDQVKGRLDKPIYVLNSESFTVWQEHFEKLKRICLDARKTSGRGWLLTLTGSKHTDFSDYPFLLPRIFRSTVGPRHTMEVFCKATYMQMGLSRQRLREQQNGAGYKVDRQGSLTEGGPNSSDAGQGARSQQSMVGDSVETIAVASPTKLAEHGVDEGWTPSVNSQSGRHGRGNMVQSPICDAKQGTAQHEAVDAHVDALSPTATPENLRARTADVASGLREDATGCSHQELREQSQHDHAEVGQQARDLLGTRHRQTSAIAADAHNAALDKGFITDVRYLKMIDADQDVQQVHEQLEEVAERLKNKSKFFSSQSLWFQRGRLAALAGWAAI
ncbi:related to acetylhydrolase [Sporisorium reilianum SRZ2]|uniref:1-alkyl-2-acetylglycerophosphocholine esterase n=1 Tax=Sporisorium reilianum (strain SRZ2) TaxID=999809 RepID=E6ZJM3_SPORE|nr:related to acetylhydrolase [Sporisorium reilianum SRZ2]